MGNTIMHEQLTINEQHPIIARHFDYERFTYPWHFHNQYEIIYVREGSGDRFVADSMEPFSPGDLVLLGGNLPHYMRSSEAYYGEDTSLRVKGVVIQFANNYMSYAINHYDDLAHIKRLLEKSKRGIHFSYPENLDLIDSIQSLPSHKGVNRILNLLLLLDKMAVTKNKRPLGTPNFEESPTSFTDSRIEKIISFINYHYTETLNLDQLATIVSMNPSAFCRYFKEKTGKLITEYIHDLRTGYACKLLISTSYDISQISIECGFNTTCHFNKIFKRKIGHTPSDFRKQFSMKNI